MVEFGASEKIKILWRMLQVLKALIWAWLSSRAPSTYPFLITIVGSVLKGGIDLGLEFRF
jgi:hypothetical protein